MPPLIDRTLTPDLYEVFLSYKKATTKVERWLAITSDRRDNEVRLTISEMQDAALYISSKRIKVPDVIYYAFDKAITARAEVTSHFSGFFATEDAKAKTASHEHFTKMLKAIFKSLCFDRLSSPNTKETTLPRPSASNRFVTLSSLPPESDIYSASGSDSTEGNDGRHEHSESFSEHAEDVGIEDDAVVQDWELHFALWDLETTCAKVKTYWTQAAEGKMSIMLAGFLTNAAIANVASRFSSRRPFFDMSTIISHEKMLAWLPSSPSDDGSQMSGLSDTVITNAFILEMHAPFVAIVLCQQGDNEDTPQSTPIMIEKPQDYLAPLDGSCDSMRLFDAEGNVFDSLLMSIKQLPPLRPNDEHDLVEGFHDLVMGFHPFIRMPDLNKEEGPIPTSATYVLRLILESYKSWYTLPSGVERVPNSNLRLHALRFAQDVHKSVVRFRLSEPFDPKPGCKCSGCSGPGCLMEILGSFESDLSKFMREKRFDLYHQSPVVAGYQMTRILARATHIGTLFCNIWQYVGVALHLYNLLRQYDLIKKEKVLLEPLCDVLGHAIFRGARPTNNFFSHYAAFQAMTYKFDQRSRKFSFGESKMSIRQFIPHNLSVMTGLNDCGCRAFCHRWDLVWRGTNKRSVTTNDAIKRTAKTAEQIASHPLVCLLDPLETIARSEWEGTGTTLPVARINWFEVYIACTEILEKISSANSQDPRDLMATHFHSYRTDGYGCGKQCVESLLSKAQQVERHDFKSICAYWNTLAGDAIRETFKDKTSADFLWNL